MLIVRQHIQRLLGASLLVLKNKSDVNGSMTEDDVRQVRLLHSTTVTMYRRQRGSQTVACKGRLVVMADCLTVLARRRQQAYC